MVYSPIVTPKAVRGWASRSFDLGTHTYDLNDFYSPDTELYKSKVLDLVSPKYIPNKAYVFDKSKYGNHGTITGPTWVQLPSGIWVLYFDGTNDKVVFTFTPNIDLGDVDIYTIIVWAKGDDFQGAVDRRIFDIGNSGNATPTVLIDFENGKVRSGHRDDASNLALLTATALDDTWYHIALVRRAANSFELYLDGVSKDTDATVVGDTALDGIQLGEIVQSGLSDLGGYIGGVRIVTRAFTTTEVRQDRDMTAWGYQ